MQDLIDAWKTAWSGYGVSDYALFFGIGIALVCAYRNWQKTFLITWVVVYGWSMIVLLSGQYIDINAGMLALWVCTYGLLGFLFLSFLIYTNLKD
ncbi:MAG: hypothetical protein KJ050_02680 [Candidatus Omnitrophica bacterium]|nr:hypothetical protein [bacterium]MCL4733815.1 hypothetical protein [Candidatus Omnitrophota bacterium]NUP91913.1 hypothetical protein [Candidatus Omnitrophota bacterium]